ncbi:MAG: lysozyme [Cetobacterium sp.]
MRTSSVGVNLIKKFEGLKLKAYKCPGGIWTIGYGTTSGVTEGMIITEEKAEDLLKKDLVRFETAVKTVVRVKLNKNQFDALVSFSYNVGTGALQSSTLLKKLNQGDYKGASEEFMRWNKAGGKVLTGLIKRREAEKELFLK